MGLDMYLFKTKKSDKKRKDTVELMYWRKANAIHKFFYDKCAQDGQEDNDILSVSKEDLIELVQLCQEVLFDLNSCPSTIEKAKNSLGDEFDYEITKYDSQVAREKLPTQSGFFFGSTDYDNYYKSYLTETMNKLQGVILETDWDNENVWYYAWY